MLRRLSLLGVALLLVSVAACAGSTETPTATARPTEPPDTTPAPEETMCRSAPPVQPSDWTQGPDGAPVRLIEYADFQCPGCARFESSLALLLAERRDQVQLVFRHFPLPYHDKAVITSEAAEAAGAQGFFWEMHDLLYQRYDDWSQLSAEEMPDVLAGYAEELGLDADQFNLALENHTFQEKVEAAYEEASAVRAPGTPTFLVNGHMFPFGLGLSKEALNLFIDTILEAPDPYDGPPPQVIQPDGAYLATIQTEEGDIVVELYSEQAPTNVNSFVFLAQEGRYDGNPFFQVVTDTVALTGDPTGSGFMMDHGYWCDQEIDPEIRFDEPGMVGLNSASRGSTSSQFFITLSPQPDFNDVYTIIGRVVEGMDVLQRLTVRSNRDPNAPPADVIETILIERR
jgi:cyclophilin family peptidyl-prolyl cis-trans isomerase/protein-disulfide isomerase